MDVPHQIHKLAKLEVEDKQEEKYKLFSWTQNQPVSALQSLIRGGTTLYKV